MNNTIELRTSEIVNYENVHAWLASKLNFPEHYGQNLDALWDLLTGYITLPITILWYDDANVSEQYTSITNLFEEAAGEIDKLEFGYILDEEATDAT